MQSSLVGVTLSVCFFFQAVFTYWMTSNLFSLGQVALLRHPAVREKLKIPVRISHPTSALPPSDGFIENVRKGTALYTLNVFVSYFPRFHTTPITADGVVHALYFSYYHVYITGWKNAQLAHQLQERERRIKDHLDIAAKGVCVCGCVCVCVCV